MTPSISILSPAFALVGLLAISIPLWMHLYQRVASRKVPISSHRLVPELPRVAKHQRKIQHWALFLLRALGVFLLGLAFSRPSLPIDQAQQKGGRETLAIVLDRSGSMAMKPVGQPSAWEEAVVKVKARLKSLHPQSRVRLIGFPSPTLGLEEDWQNPSDARNTLDEFTLTLAEGSPFEAIEEASKALVRFRSEMPESLEIYSDFQENGWDQIEKLTLPEELQIDVIRVGDSELINRGLSLQVRGRDQLRRAVVLSEGGPAPLRIEAKTVASGELDQTELPFPDEVVELPYRSDEIGWSLREVTYQEPNDGLLQDDTLFDVFYMTPEIPVYLLEPEPEKEAFLQATFFISQALRPSIGEAAKDSRFIPTVVPVSESTEFLRNVESTEAIVVVPALETWPSGLPEIVEELVRKGAAVVFFAGPSLDPKTYARSWEALLPAMPGETLEITRSLTLPPIDELNPIWGALPDAVRRGLRRLAIEKRFQLDPKENSETITEYSDGVPMIVSKTLGQGKALFFNASIDRSWGDWPTVGALYVPTMHGAMSAVVTANTQLLRNSNSTGIVGVPFDVRVESEFADTEVFAGDLALTSDSQGWVEGLVFEDPGVYELKTSEGEVVRPVAVNFPPEESERDMLLPTVLVKQLEARRRTSEGQEAEAPEISMANESMLWRWILIALVLIWVLEPFLAFRPSPSPSLQKGTAS